MAPARKNDRHHYTLSFVVAVAHCADLTGDASDDSQDETPSRRTQSSSDDDQRPTAWRPGGKPTPPRRRRRRRDDRLFLAHCFPYTYSDLRRELGALDDCPGPSVVRRRRLCATLAGNDCDLLTITNFATRDPAAVRNRAGVVLTARVHPGESNASFMMRGCVEFLCSNDPRAVVLRDNFVFKVVPMMNPDGVINGNYRSSLAGEDLNRRYATPSATLQPTVYAVKQLLRTTHEARGVLFYCDAPRGTRKNLENRQNVAEMFRSTPISTLRTKHLEGPVEFGDHAGDMHGHSRKKNVFLSRGNQTSRCILFCAQRRSRACS